MCFCGGDCYLVGSEDLRAVQKRHTLAVCEELERGLEACVTAPHDCHVFALEERPVAGSAVGETLLVVFLGARYLKLPASRARGYEERFCRDGAFVSKSYFHVVVKGCKRNSSRARLDLKEIARIGFHMLFEGVREVRSVDGGCPYPVLYLGRHCTLSAPVLDDEKCFELLARGVHCRRGACGAASDDYQVIHMTCKYQVSGIK